MHKSVGAEKTVLWESSEGSESMWEMGKMSVLLVDRYLQFLANYSDWPLTNTYLHFIEISDNSH